MIKLMYLVIVLYSGGNVPVADLRIPFESLETCNAMGETMNAGEMLGISATLLEDGYHWNWDCLDQDAVDKYNALHMERHQAKPPVDVTIPLW